MSPEAYERRKRRSALKGRTAQERARIEQWQANHPERVREYKRRWQERNKDKRKAHVALNNAVRDGRIHKQPCEVCGQLKVTAHHDNYSQPLVVRWLCPAHHAELHRIYQ